jgi:maltooligosyltrehalose trehalohydrolase
MTPLLFMGQEWAASTPFPFFSDHGGELGRAIALGRRRELAGFAAFADPAKRDAIPDPQARETFAASKLLWEERAAGDHGRVLALYRELIAMRRADPVLGHPSRADLRAEARGDVLVVRRTLGDDLRILAVNFGPTDAPLRGLELPPGLTQLVTSGSRFDGERLAPQSAALFAGRTLT